MNIDAIKLAHEQAHLSVGTYLEQARRMIDEEFGRGFAEKNPALVGACVQAAMSHVNSTAIASSLSEVANSLDALAPSMEQRNWPIP